MQYTFCVVKVGKENMRVSKRLKHFKCDICVNVELSFDQLKFIVLFEFFAIDFVCVYTQWIVSSVFETLLHWNLLHLAANGKEARAKKNQQGEKAIRTNSINRMYALQIRNYRRFSAKTHIIMELNIDSRKFLYKYFFIFFFATACYLV